MSLYQKYFAQTRRGRKKTPPDDYFNTEHNH